MIFEIKKLNSLSDYIVDDPGIIAIAEETKLYNSIKIGSEQNANELLALNQQEALEVEKLRFSIALTVIEGTDTTWREMIESDPEEYLYQVFNTATGQYKQCSNKTEAVQENELRKQEFLTSVGLNSVITLESIDSLPKKRKSKTK